MKIKTELGVDGLIHIGMSLGIRVIPGRNGTIRLHQYVPKEAWKGKSTRHKDVYGDAYYQALSLSDLSHRSSAVCWHGFRDFMACLYEHDPYAVVRSAVATYHNRDEFEALYPATGKKEVGGEDRPLFYCQACRCYDRGRIPFNRYVVQKRIHVIEQGGDGRWTQ